MTKTTQSTDESPKYSLAVLGIVLVIGLVGFGAYQLLSKHDYNPTFPAQLRTKAQFTIFYPVHNTVMKVDDKSFKYDPNGKLLSYTAYTGNKNKLIVTEQPAPDSLLHGQKGFEALARSFGEYSEIKTTNGAVALTHPAQFNGGQFAIMRAKGVLLAVRPDKPLTDQQWQQLFNSFQVEK